MGGLGVGGGWDGNDLRHSQAMWSSMFMASKTDVKVDTFQALMNATNLAGKGAGSSGAGPSEEAGSQNQDARK